MNKSSNTKRSSLNLSLISNMKTLKAPKYFNPKFNKSKKRSTLVDNDIKGMLNVIYSPRSSKKNSKSRSKSNTKSKISKSKKSISKSSNTSSDKSLSSFISHNETV